MNICSMFAGWSSSQKSFAKLAKKATHLTTVELLIPLEKFWIIFLQAGKGCNVFLQGDRIYRFLWLTWYIGRWYFYLYIEYVSPFLFRKLNQIKLKGSIITEEYLNFNLIKFIFICVSFSKFWATRARESKSEALFFFN